MSEMEGLAEAARKAAAAGEFTQADGVIREGELSLAVYKSEQMPLYFCLVPGYGYAAGDSWASLARLVKNVVAWIKAQETK